MALKEYTIKCPNCGTKEYAVLATPDAIEMLGKRCPLCNKGHRDVTLRYKTKDD